MIQHLSHVVDLKLLQDDVELEEETELLSDAQQAGFLLLCDVDWLLHQLVPVFVSFHGPRVLDDRWPKVIKLELLVLVCFNLDFVLRFRVLERLLENHSHLFGCLLALTQGLVPLCLTLANLSSNIQIQLVWESQVFLVYDLLRRQVKQLKRRNDRVFL